MLSYLLQNPVRGVLAIVTTAWIVNEVEKYDKYLGKFLETDLFFAALILLFMAVYGAFFAISKAFAALMLEILPQAPSRKQVRPKPPRNRKQKN